MPLKIIILLILIHNTYGLCLCGSAFALKKEVVYLEFPVRLECCQNVRRERKRRLAIRWYPPRIGEKRLCCL